MTREQRKERARQIRSLVEDGGWTRKEAAELVDAGFGEEAAAVKVQQDSSTGA